MELSLSKLWKIVKNREASMLESMGLQRVDLPVYPYSGIEINRKKKRIKYMYCGMDEQQNHYAQLKKKARYNRQYVM